MSIFWKHKSEYWKENKNLMLFYQSLLEKHLKLKTMPRLDSLIHMDAQVHKFTENINLNDSNYDRQAIEGLMLHSFRYAKHIYADQIINEAHSLYFDNEVRKKNSKYFDKIDIKNWFNVYSSKYSNLIEASKSNAADLMTVYEKTHKLSVMSSEIYEYENSKFKSTFIQEFIRAYFDNKFNLLDENLKRKFVVGDMFVDAAMWCADNSKFHDSVAEKYDLNSLIEILNQDVEWYHFFEAITWLLRWCFSKENSSDIQSSSTEFYEIRKWISLHFHKISDLSTIDKIRFAIELTRLIFESNINLWGKIKLQVFISNLFFGLLNKKIEIFAKPNVFDLAEDVVFLDKELIRYNNAIIDNQFYQRDVVLEAHQKELTYSRHVSTHYKVWINRSLTLQFN